MVPKPPSPRRISAASIFAYAGCMTAMLYLLLFHLAPDAPMYSHGIPPKGLARQRALLDSIDGLMNSIADGRNIQYHVRGTPQDWAANGRTFDAVYLSAVYHQYPARVRVGTDDTIINSPVDLCRADKLPSDAWLAQHRIPAVFNLLPGDQDGPKVLIHLVR